MRVVTDDKHYKDIAAAIRENTGTENTYTPEEMPAGVNEVYYKGEYNFFHKVLLNGGSRTDIENMFKGSGDLSNYAFPENYKPVYTRSLFNGYKGEKLPKGLNFSNITTSSGTPPFEYLFYNCSNLTEIYDLNIGTKNIFSLNYTFTNCRKLVKIDTPLRIYSSTTFSYTFSSCDALEEVAFIGAKIQKSIDFKSSQNLSVKTVKHIIEWLNAWDETSSNAYKNTLTLNQKAFDRLVAAEPTTEWADTEGNTTQITWEEYIDNKKWNLSLKS